MKFYFDVMNCFHYFITLLVFLKTSLWDLFTSSLWSLIILIIAMWKSLSYASAILHFSGLTVVVLLGSGGGALSWLLMFVLLHWCLGTWGWDDCESRY